MIDKQDYICNLGYRKNSEEDMESFCITWSNLSFLYEGINRERKIVLSEFSGSVQSGELIAILGPSGAGKSTFLNSLAGMKKPFCGNIKFYGREKQASFAYVPQRDDLCPYLTVKEALLLSSRLKNHQKFNSSREHLDLVNYFIKQFSLEKCSNTFSRNCSGGEAKRLSIALELISSPQFLLLDEPTSGLDSSTALKCIDSLKNSVTDKNTNRPAVIITIHQPNSNLFHIFDKVYILSNGWCIYEGAPADMVPHFAKLDIFCPTYYNPADFALELACQGPEHLHIEKLRLSYLKNGNVAEVDSTVCKPIKSDNLRQSRPFILSYFLLVKKLLLCHFRDPHQVMSRLVQYLVFPIVIATCIDLTYYKQSPCSYVIHNSTHIRPETLLEQVDRRKYVAQCLLLLFFNSFFVFMSANFPGILTVGNHIRVFFKEQRNNWYSTTSFSLAFLTVATLLTGIFTCLNSISVYFIFFEKPELAQLVMYCWTNILTGCVGDALAILISVINPHDALTSIIIAGIYIAITLTLGGFVIRFSFMNSFAWLVSQISCFRYILQMLVKNLFHHKDCIVAVDKVFSFEQVLGMFEYYKHRNHIKIEVTEDLPKTILNNLKDETWDKNSIFSFAQSISEVGETGMQTLQTFWEREANYVGNEFDVDHYSIWRDVGLLLVCLGVFHLSSYFILLYRTRRR